MMADAFGATFWWALALVVLAFLAALALPKHKPEPVHDPDDPDGEAAAAPVLVAH